MAAALAVTLQGVAGGSCSQDSSRLCRAASVAGLRGASALPLPLLPRRSPPPPSASTTLRLAVEPWAMAVGEAVREALGEGEPPGALGVGEGEGVGRALGRRVMVPLGVAGGEGEAPAAREGEAGALREGVAQALALGVVQAEGEALGVTASRPVSETEMVCVSVGEALAVPVAVALRVGRALVRLALGV